MLDGNWPTTPEQSQSVRILSKTRSQLGGCPSLLFKLQLKIKFSNEELKENMPLNLYLPWDIEKMNQESC